MNNKETIKRGDQLWWVTLFATALFVVMFIFKQAGGFDFWYWMSSNLVILLGFVFIIDRSNGHELLNDFNTATGKKILGGLLAHAGNPVRMRIWAAYIS